MFFFKNYPNGTMLKNCNFKLPSIYLFMMLESLQHVRHNSIFSTCSWALYGIMTPKLTTFRHLELTKTSFTYQAWPKCRTSIYFKSQLVNNPRGHTFLTNEIRSLMFSQKSCYSVTQLTKKNIQLTARSWNPTIPLALEF